MDALQADQLKRKTRRHAGFTLTELAIVLLIVALLIGGLLVPFTAQMDLRAYGETQKAMAEIQEALYGYAASHQAADGRPYLPCADKVVAIGAGTPNDGQEDRAGAGCEAFEGNVPWVTLGIAPTDAWLNRFRYRVVPAFSNTTTGFTLGTAATLRVCEQAACTSYIANNLPVVILSHGRNGAGAINSGTGVANAAPTGRPDELANTDGNDDFVSHEQREGAATEFDDVVVWLPANLLFSRMIAAGRLP